MVTEIIDDVDEILYDLKDSGLFYTTVKVTVYSFNISIRKKGGDARMKLDGELKDTIIRLNDYFKSKGFSDNIILSFTDKYNKPLVVKSVIKVKGDDIYTNIEKLSNDVTIISATLKFYDSL